MWSLIVVFCGVRMVAGSNLSDEKLHQIPRLFYLDDYERCLAEPTALYCLGEFRLSPTVTPHQVYDFITNYSSREYSFDHTLLHRGYCVTSRCANAPFNRTSSEAKLKRFRDCVQKWARPLKMTTHLEKLHYCRVPEDRLLENEEAQAGHSTNQLFLKITFSILLLNVVGTVYDLMRDTNDNGHRLLLAWSVRDNWRRLVENNSNDKTDSLKSMQGYRIVVTACVLFGHCMMIHYMVYTSNPYYLEQISAQPLSKVVKSGALVVQVCIVFSSFLLAFNLLHFEKKPLNFSRLPKITVRRLARIAPVYFYVLLFAVSWWPLLHDGAMWQLLVGSESRICRRKFWSHLFFVNNYLENNSHCFVQTWYLAADMQLYIFAAIVTLAIAQFKFKPLPILGTMFVVSCLFNVVLAYILYLKPLALIAFPEKMRTLFKDQESFSLFYISTWGSLPSCILGLYVAHKHYYEEVEGKKIQHSTIFHLINNMAIPATIAWLVVGYFAGIDNRIFSTLWLGLERPVFSLLVAVKLYSLCKKIENTESRVLSGHGFVVLGRLSLSVLLLHWVIYLYSVAGASALLYTSYYGMILDTIPTWVLSYGLAVPVTVLLEMPVYRSVSVIY